MLATFVIGLREGLEAALIVGIVAAFLRQNGKSLAAVWLGVGLAIALSVAVGVALNLVEQALPQAQQEGMEAIIGGVAVCFVTAMIAWMNTHAAGLRKELEADAAAALSRGSAYALAGMAFLAVLREGFETSVFLLATFAAAQSVKLAAAGAMIGLLMAAGFGWGIYAGGVRINLARFFRVTGGFLVLVAAGLVVSSLRAAHEAGWLNAGQQPTVDLSWLVAPGTIRSALITGVLGIPAAPRLIEVIGWLAYLVPVATWMLWPAARRPRPRQAARLRLAGAAALGLVAIGLAVLYPHPRLRLPVSVPLVTTDGSDRAVGTARLHSASGDAPPVLDVSIGNAGHTALPLPPAQGRPDAHDGIATSAWSIVRTAAPAAAPATLDFDQVLTLNGGRRPVGLNPARHPGPFAAEWAVARKTDVWVADGALVDVAGRSTTLVTLSGGGLQGSRTLSVADPATPAASWQVATAYRNRAAAMLGTAAAARAEWRFWAVHLPIALAIAALALAAFSGRALIRLRRAAAPTNDRSTTTARHSGEPAPGATHATH